MFAVDSLHVNLLTADKLMAVDSLAVAVDFLADDTLAVDNWLGN